jgi:hypothetical protein
LVAFIATDALRSLCPHHNKIFSLVKLFKQSKKVKIRWCQIWYVGWMLHDFPLQFPEGFQCAGCSMGMGIVAQQQDVLWQSPWYTLYGTEGYHATQNMQTQYWYSVVLQFHRPSLFWF